MPGEDSEDTWASEDTFPAKTLLGAKTRGRPKTLPERRALANALPVVKPCSREKTVAEDRSGEGTRRREDTWGCEDTSRRQVGRRPASRRTHGRAKTVPEDRSPEDRSGEDPRRREDTWACEDRSRRQVGRTRSSPRRHVAG